MKTLIKSAKIEQGETTCDCCGARIKNVVVISHFDGTTQEVGTTCFRKRYGFKPNPKGYSGLIKIEYLCGGSAVKTVAAGLHNKPEYLKTVGLTKEQVETLAELEAAGTREVCRVEWNRPYYWQLAPVPGA